MGVRQQHGWRPAAIAGLLAITGGALIGTAAPATAEGPALTVVKSSDEAAVAAGDWIHFHVTVTNTGTVPLTGVTIVDEVAPGCVEPLADLAVGAFATIDCIVLPGLSDVGTLTNIATVDTAETEPVASNPVAVAVSTPRCGGLDVTVLLATLDEPTGGDDVILGSDEGDDVDALAGDDVVCVGEGADWVHGGQGADRIYGGTRRDRIYGGGADDTNVGGTHRDQISGGPGNDRIDGGEHPDVLSGDGGADDMVGGERVDIVDGGPGDDRLRGLAGNDVVAGGRGDDTLLGGDGDDLLDGNGNRDRLLGGRGRDRCRGGAGQQDTAVGCEVVHEVP